MSPNKPESTPHILRVEPPKEVPTTKVVVLTQVTNQQKNK